ncbi:MAG: ABC transporter permease [Spirochaetales bacterium]|nr:ABC transporter permease [Spirochaetales bacterium]MBP7264167.1 ABC transporter permease [Spirochaetia bacterium]
MHHHHDQTPAWLRRLAFIGRRMLRAVLSYVAAVVCMTAVVNASLEKTVMSQIVEAAQGAVMARGDFDAPEDVAAYKQEVIESMKRAYGLHLPSLVRIARRTAQVVSLDLGKSSFYVMKDGERSYQVKDIIADYLPHTLLLFTSSTLVSALVGIGMGMRMAKKPGSLLDHTGTHLTMLLYGTPTWWVASFMVLFFVYVLPVFRMGQLRSLVQPDGWFLQALDYLSYILLPLLTLVLVKAWGFAYFTRAMVIPHLQEDFVMAARARGLPERRVLRSHGLRVAAPGIATLGVQAFASSLMGDILVEKVVARPGLGSALFMALGWNDVPLITGILAMILAIYCLSYLFLDVFLSVMDPRISYGRT